MTNASTTGAFFVIDGTDGSGKATQTRKLVDRFISEGHQVETISFPQYGSKSAGGVENYLAGKYGKNAKDVNAKAASILYAVDRFDASFQIREWLAQGKIVVSDRYVGSNMGHQGGKITDSKARSEYLAWNDNLEHEIFQIPRPTVNIVLSVSVETAFKLAAKGATEKTKVKGDIHESDQDLLRASIETYRVVATTYPNFHLVDCAPTGDMRTIEDIHEEVWNTIQKSMAQPMPEFIKQEVAI
jgi:dTMP kinase